MTTTYMNLDLPTVSSTLGPEWATLLNAALTSIDSHDHSSGNGALITPAGILINALLDFYNYQIKDVASVGLYDKASADTDYKGSLQRINNNLYWVNPAGASVQLTNGTSIVSTGSGALSLTAPGAWPYSVTTADNAKVVLVDTVAARTISLPAATDTMYFYVKDKNNGAQDNNITVTPDGTDTIDGANSNYTIDWNEAFVGFISDGVSSWYVM